MFTAAGQAQKLWMAQWYVPSFYGLGKSLAPMEWFAILHIINRLLYPSEPSCAVATVNWRCLCKLQVIGNSCDSPLDQWNSWIDCRHLPEFCNHTANVTNMENTKQVHHMISQVLSLTSSRVDCSKLLISFLLREVVMTVFNWWLLGLLVVMITSQEVVSWYVLPQPQVYVASVQYIHQKPLWYSLHNEAVKA